MRFFLFFFCGFSILFSQERILYIATVPDSCKIFIDGSLKGLSPLSVSDSIGFSRIDIRKPGYLPFTQSREKSESDFDTLNVTMREAAKLTVMSSPESASVFIDSSYYGRTPLTIDTLSPRLFSLSVVKQYHQPFVTMLTGVSGESIAITPVLEPFKGFVTIHGTSPTSKYFWDGTELNQVGQPFEVLFGSHQLVVKDSRTGETARQTVVVASKENRTFTASMNRFSVTKMGIGIILPGWNQFFDGNLFKMRLYVGAVIGTVAYSTYAQLEFLQTRQIFQDAQYEYTYQANSVDLAASARKKLDEKYEFLKTATTRLNTSRILLGLVWLINAYDVISNHSIENTINESADGFSLHHNSQIHEYAIRYKITL